MNKICSFLLYLLFITTLTSCNNPVKWSQIESFSEVGWNSSNELDFRLQKGDDTTLQGDLYLLLNSVGSSQLMALPLRMEITTPHNEVWCDTLNLVPEMVKDSGIRRMYETRIIQNCDFNLDGVYQIKLMQLLGNDIEGVTEVGLSINK